MIATLIGLAAAACASPFQTPTRAVDAYVSAVERRDGAALEAMTSASFEILGRGRLIVQRRDELIAAISECGEEGCGYTAGWEIRSRKVDHDRVSQVEVRHQNDGSLMSELVIYTTLGGCITRIDIPRLEGPN